MDLKLDLDNFDTPEAEGSRYVLTSPRSLEACAQVNVRPVNLLHKPLNDFIEENPGKPLELNQVFYANHEKHRVELLEKCKVIRRTLIMQAELEAKKKARETNSNKIKSVKSSSSNINSQRSKSMPLKQKLPSPHAQKVVKSFSYDNNNNINDTDSIYEVIPYEERKATKTQNKNVTNITNGSLSSSKLLNGLKPKYAVLLPEKSVVSPKYSISKPVLSNSQESKKERTNEAPYMISTPKGIGSHKYATTDKNWKAKKIKKVKDENISSVQEQQRTPRNAKQDKFQTRKRSKSVEVLQRQTIPIRDQLPLFSSLSLTKGSKSGYSTPQMEKDRKVVEVMKEKRKQEERSIKERYKKMLEWNEDKKKINDKRLTEEYNKQKFLAQSFKDWEKGLKEKDEKKRREEMKMNLERKKQQHEIEMRIKNNKLLQEKIKLELINERKKQGLERKKQQEQSKKSVEREYKNFQEETQIEVEERLRKAEKTKLEMEMKELNKIQMMNKRQREHYEDVRKQLERQNEIEENRLKKEHIDKMTKAEIIVKKQLLERDKTLKQKSKELNYKTEQTRKNKEETEIETEKYIKSQVQHKEKKIVVANTVAEKMVHKRAKRAQKLRESSQREQELKKKELLKAEAQELERIKEELESKEVRALNHIKLKETAIQLSRANARASEAARNEVKRKDATFLQSMNHANLNAEIGKGLRTSIANQSSIKLG